MAALKGMVDGFPQERAGSAERIEDVPLKLCDSQCCDCVGNSRMACEDPGLAAAASEVDRGSPTRLPQHFFTCGKPVRQTGRHLGPGFSLKRAEAQRNGGVMVVGLWPSLAPLLIRPPPEVIGDKRRR